MWRMWRMFQGVSGHPLLIGLDNTTNESFLHERASGTSLDVLLAAP